MIKLIKTPEPPILSQNFAAWTQALIDKIAANLQPTDAEKNKYRHKDVKKALVEETHGKCAYCESKLLHITYGDVEHIVPKSTATALTFKLENLTLACDVCNTNKGDKFSGGTGFIDPYLVDPENHFMACGPLIHGKPGNDPARVTEETLKLNRPELIERRTERIRSLREQVETFHKASSALKPLLLQNLKKELEADKEYVAVSRAYLMPLLT